MYKFDYLNYFILNNKKCVTQLLLMEILALVKLQL